MQNKKILALSLATAMLLGSSLSVSAATGTAENATGETITGSGDINYVDTTVYNVTIPTTSSLDLTVDPQGLSGMTGETATEADLAAYAGKITSSSKPIINNLSSKPMKVSVALQVTGDATAVTTTAAVDADTSNNVLLYAVPSATDVKGSVDNYSASATGIVMKKDAAVTVDFILPEATYNFTKAGSDYGYALADGETGHGTALSFEGLVNKNADWSAYIAESSPKTIGMTAKFTFTNTLDADTDVADATEGAPFAMKAYTGDKVTVTPADVAPSISDVTYSIATGGALTIPYSLGAGASAATAVTDIALEYGGAFYSINGVWNYATNCNGQVTINPSSIVISDTWMGAYTAGTYDLYVVYDDNTETYDVITITVTE